IGSPFGSSLWINYCPFPSNQDASELSELERQNRELQGQLDRLLGNVAGRREQCAIGASPPVAVTPPPTPVAPPAPPPPAPPAPTPPPKPTIKIAESCKGAECLKSLEGCWGSPTNFFQNMGTPRVKSFRAHEQWCFDKNGSGHFRMETVGEPHIVCQGPIS